MRKVPVPVERNKVSIHLIEKYLFKSQKVNQQLTRQFQKMDLQACTFNAN